MGQWGWVGEKPEMYMYTYIYVCMYVCMYVFMYMYMFMYVRVISKLYICIKQLATQLYVNVHIYTYL